MCDRQCRKKGFKFKEIAAMMVEEDGEPHTIKPLSNVLQLEASREGTNQRWVAPEANCRLP